MKSNRDTHGSSDEEWIGFDLDGTLAKYDGWKGIDHIGPPIATTVVVAKMLHRLGKKIKILTARVAPREDGLGGDNARKYVEKWCRGDLGFVPEITDRKDSSMTALFDDRAIAVEQNTGKILGGWMDFLPEASEKAKKVVISKIEKEADARPSKEDLWRMYDIMQADARLAKKVEGLGFGRNGDAYRRAAIKLKVMELARVLQDGKKIRNNIAHKPGYIPSEQDANRALRQYADAEAKLKSLS